MRRLVKFIEPDGPAFVNPDSVEVIRHHGSGATIDTWGDKIHVAEPLAEVAARLGFTLDEGEPEQAGDDTAIEAFADAIRKINGYGWVSGPGVPTKYAHSFWGVGKAWLLDDFVIPGSRPLQAADHSWESSMFPDAQRCCLALARWLWSLGYREISRDKPEQAHEPTPAPPDPVALLAAGKRCRFVRDAGTISPEVPEVIDGKLIKVDDFYLIAFNLPGKAIQSHGVEHIFCSDWNRNPHTTAKYAVPMIERLGYRFAGEAQS